MTFGSRVAFADLETTNSVDGDRREFLGRNGTLDNPAALAGEAILSQRVGAGLDPAALFNPRSNSSRAARWKIVLLLLGEATTAADAQSLIARYRRRISTRSCAR